MRWCHWFLFFPLRFYFITNLNFLSCWLLNTSFTSSAFSFLPLVCPMYLQSFTLTSFKSYPYMRVPLFLFTVVTLLIMKLPNYLRINFAWLNVCLVCTREFAQFEIAHGQMIHLLTPSPHSYTALKSFKSKVKGTIYKINSRGEKLPYWKVRLVHCLTLLSLLILLSMSPCYPKIF